MLKLRSRFCLEPSGDSPYRKSIADSVAMGCIPVIFSEITAKATPWHWEGWKSSGLVHVPRLEFLTGALDLKSLLESLPPALERKMRAAVASNGHKWQYALDDSVQDDAFKMLLKGAAIEAQSRCPRASPDWRLP